ncbi:MAG: T9SS type A sorting domain-containing protein [Gammaproteobacteria bacterium]|nr:T9SS type A sorting domain-containing protein [Gammaproteobacteria bacterium]
MKQWWQNLTTRERQIVLAGGLMLLLVILYQNLWSPLQQHLRLQRNQVQQLQQQLGWMQQQAPLVRQLKRAPSPGASRTGDITGTLSNSSQAYQIALKRIQPQGDNALVEIDITGFDQLVNWLGMLEQQHGITPQQIDLQRTGEPGKIMLALNIQPEKTGEANVVVSATSNGKTIYHSFQVMVTVPVSAPAFAEMEWKVYPNPVQNLFYVELPSNARQIALFTSQGELIFEQNIFGESKVEVDQLVGKPSGIYFLKVLAGNEMLTQKIIRF